MATLALLCSLTASSLSAANRTIAVRLTPESLARLDADQQIYLEVVPTKGDAWTRLALRITGDAALWKVIASTNGMDQNLQAGRRVRIPYAMLRDELQHQVIRALFPADRPIADGWMHTVVAGTDYEGESLWRIAEWFSGDGANYAAIRAANPSHALSTRRGETILVPSAILAAGFAAAIPGANDDEVRLAEDDPSGDPGLIVHADLSPAVRSAQPVSLEYHRDSDRPYAVYRLRRGEALYSSVGIRFTGRVYARDVNEVVEELVAFNGIEDVSRLPVGYAVRIPMELLTPDNRPPDDPVRIEWERSKRESARLAKRIEARDLEGIRVVIDPGHGGRDVGTIHDGVWESTYVYDVACRLKSILEARSGATVSMTTRSATLGYKVPDQDVLRTVGDHELLTNPKYDLEDPIVGVNLRWYLANSIYHDFVRAASAPERIVFVSLHADSLHPSLRGAMAYIPGERFVQGTYTKTGKVYLARTEVKAHPTVTLTRKEALQSEGLSRELAETIIARFAGHELEVHPFQPVREHVVRSRREWVPAVIRYNRIPTRILLEICNLGNAGDRRLLTTRQYRQRVAEATYAGIVDFFARQQPDAMDSTAIAAGGR